MYSVEDFGAVADYSEIAGAARQNRFYTCSQTKGLA